MPTNLNEGESRMDQEIPQYSLPPEISNRLDAAIFSSRPLQEVLDLVLETALVSC